MTYKIYQTVLSKEEYFKSWDSDNYAQLTKNIEDGIYEKYVMKAKVFQRDEFKCQNTECTFDAPLTLHHVKWQKNGGKNTVRNGITLCRTCHQRFHRGKAGFQLANLPNVPAHIRGYYFKFEVETKVSWKTLKAEMKVLRKNLKGERVTLTWKQLVYLMKFLDVRFDENNFDDD